MMCITYKEAILRCCQATPPRVERHQLALPETSHLQPPTAPIITHTAATPQGSPNATFDSSRESCRLSPNNSASSQASLHATTVNDQVLTVVSGADRYFPRSFIRPVYTERPNVNLFSFHRASRR